MILNCQLVPQLLSLMLHFYSKCHFPFQFEALLTHSYWFYYLVFDTHVKSNIRTNVHRAITTDGSCCEMTLSCIRAHFLPILRKQILHLEKNVIGFDVFHPSTSCLSSATSRTSSTVSGYEVTFIKQQQKRKKRWLFILVCLHFPSSPYFPSSTIKFNSYWQIFAEILTTSIP